MLTRNLDTLNGLVSGAFGMLIKVVRSENDGQIIKLGLRMDNRQPMRHNHSANAASDDLVYIERAEESLKFKGAVRRQFPVKLAFACTIHKTQGLTTQTAVVSMKNIFEPGMAYVALSRVTSLSGLYLQDLDENKIYANPEVTAALQTMRQASVEEMMPLLQSLTSKAPLLQTVFIWTATPCSNATDMCPTQTFLTWPAEVVVELLCI
ncbi:ATP-dependent DNA helicase PIF1-like isoform X1 [Oreochromis niloticus]|uniref:ATP-dependent DNA helicase PIF1-like isoform X1 n=1 Tax=Oreochromis niloticus TaxID=8128 RepID=UPI000DF10E15|nr:ATP-dependent DNA helicase PIF1-like isoform X1 [Oreochromis niloticus]